MPLASKNNALIVKDGKLATDCACCCPLSEYSMFEWTGTPTASPGFCACYWNSAPLVKSISECGAYAGIPLAGLSRGRYGNVSQSSLAGVDGSASGYPTYRNFDQLRRYSSAADMSWPGQEYANASLRATKSALYLPDDTLIGLHSASAGQPGVLEGSSVENPYMNGSGHGYKITPVSLSDATDLRDAQKGRSLKFCDGNWIADPSKPWKVTANVAGWPQGLSRPSYRGGESLHQYWQESWSHETVLDSLVRSSTGMPLIWSLSSSSSVSQEGGFIFGRGVQATLTDNNAHTDNRPPENGDFIGSGSQWPDTTACSSGCEVKYLFNVSVTLRIPLSQYGLGTVVLTDTVYCDRVYSPCISSGGSSWTSPATRRNMVITSSSGDRVTSFSPYLGIIVHVPNENDSFTFEV